MLPVAPLSLACSGNGAAAAGGIICAKEQHTNCLEKLSCLGKEVCFQADQIALGLYRIQSVEVLVQQQLRGVHTDISGRHAVSAAAGRLCRPCCAKRS